MRSNISRSGALARGAHQFVQRVGSRVEHVVGLLGAGDGELGRVEQPDLHQERRLIPIDVLVERSFALELRHDAERQSHVPARRSDARRQLIHLDVMCEREDELVDDLVVANGPRDRRDLDVRRPLPNEVLSVEATLPRG